MSRYNFTISVCHEDIGLQTLSKNQKAELLTSRSSTSLKLCVVLVAETLTLSCLLLLEAEMPPKS